MPGLKNLFDSFSSKNKYEYLHQYRPSFSSICPVKYAYRETVDIRLPPFTIGKKLANRGCCILEQESDVRDCDTLLFKCSFLGTKVKFQHKADWIQNFMMCRKTPRCAS